MKSKFFDNFLTLAVFFNTTVLALDGSFQDQQTADLLALFNEVFTWIFIAEMAIKLLALTPMGYIRDKMNIFDGVIVVLSIVEMTILSGDQGKAVSAFRAVRIFRTFRVLRVTRLLRSLAFMQVIIGVISRTINSFIYIALLLMLFIFIYALLGMQMYGGKYVFRDNRLRPTFDSFHHAFLAIF